MNDMKVAQPEQIVAAAPPSRRSDPLRRWTLIILVIGVVLFGWTMIADRLTPYTSDASVRAFVFSGQVGWPRVVARARHRPVASRVRGPAPRRSHQETPTS